MKKVLVPIANGSEEIESVCIIDTLRRAGADVTVASVEATREVTCSRSVRILADALITDCLGNVYDLVALPGGMPGAERLRDSDQLKELLTQQKQSGRLYAAVCASPDDKQATCYPAQKFVDALKQKDNLEQRVVVDGNCVTSRGPGTALEFALQLVEQLYGAAKAQEIQKAMLVPSY
ncbi:DJ1 family protein [Acanthamoeba castellanii str. Neff]|uniref:DJ1 family protein n=1 Tax=Acanthamoeba castellanii (strain ATCC 30010 / Neff) TaxID=1257118 RepID=L8GRN3_ACACF|nr:DJ1 family protein [Acanthamoeba castellanii str. Neff]ELR15610.1 DJ1 family protein [Acanthamoeba castellanii str. Neff]